MSYTWIRSRACYFFSFTVMIDLFLFVCRSVVKHYKAWHLNVWHLNDEQRVTVLCWYRLIAQLYDFRTNTSLSFDIVRETGMYIHFSCAYTYIMVSVALLYSMHRSLLYTWMCLVVSSNCPIMQIRTKIHLSFHSVRETGLYIWVSCLCLCLCLCFVSASVSTSVFVCVV